MDALRKPPRVEARDGDTIWTASVYVAHGLEVRAYCTRATVIVAAVPVVHPERGEPRMLYFSEATFATEAEARQHIVRELCGYRDLLNDRVAEEMRLAARAEIAYDQVS